MPRERTGPAVRSNSLATADRTHDEKMTDTIEQIIDRLGRFNDWRRGAEFDQPEPAQVGRDIDAAIELLATLSEKIERIRSWCDAYPVSVFPEPDMTRVSEILKQHGITLDSVSASNMRHVLSGIKKIIDT